MSSEFKSFVMPKAKMLPVFLLLDVSGSMSMDNKMDELNLSVREMLETFKEEQAIQAEINVCIITFGSTVEKVCELTPATEINYVDLIPGGVTRMGDAFKLAKEIIEDKDKLPKNSYRPVVVLVSDGEPYDPKDPGNRKFKQQLDEFVHIGRTSKCDRWGLAIGADADINVMQDFINHPEKKVCYAEDAADIHKFFRFISSSTIQRSKSKNPNVVPDDLFSVDVLNLKFD